MSPTFEGAWDCHAHLFGPYERYPLLAARSYSPPEATETEYADLLETLGLGHGVLIHPSAYGERFELVLDTLSRRPAWRGVLVLRADHRLANLASLRDKGIRALRFSARQAAGGNFTGSASFDDLEALAPNMAEAGLHAELWTDCESLASLEHRLSALPVPVVLDHMAGFVPSAGTVQEGFRALLRLLEGGKTWVKLCAYRNVLGHGELALARPFHEALMSAHPERLIWGTDWPHIRVDPTPDTKGLLEAFLAWTPDAALRRQILCSNPAHLYA